MRICGVPIPEEIVAAVSDNIRNFVDADNRRLVVKRLLDFGIHLRADVAFIGEAVDASDEAIITAFASRILMMGMEWDAYTRVTSINVIDTVRCMRAANLAAQVIVRYMDTSMDINKMAHNARKEVVYSWVRDSGFDPADSPWDLS